ncbi:MAG TPA: methyltransferase domain-containing protein [Anaerolineae bacterium]|nr:methyltransferase domain-containing protein [Anaerolineae bacterium]
MTRPHLTCEGAQGRITLGNVFEVSEIPFEYFDVVYSLGFIEHFQDTAIVVKRLSRYARTGGIIITLIPNLQGLVGWLHRTVDPDLYRKHVVIDSSMLDAIHSESGLKVVLPANYFGTFCLTVVNFNRLRSHLPPVLDSLIWRGIKLLQELVVVPFRLVRVTPETRLFSPYVVGVYER